MRSPWFRMYIEARNDAKLRSLTDPQHRLWFNLLCYAAEQNGERGTIPLNDDAGLLALEVADGDTELLESTVERLVRLHIIERGDDTLTFIHFEDRQYDCPSDKPAAVMDRVKRHRDNLKRDETTGNETKHAIAENNRDIAKNNIPPHPPPDAGEGAFWDTYVLKRGLHKGHRLIDLNDEEKESYLEYLVEHGQSNHRDAVAIRGFQQQHPTAVEVLEFNIPDYAK